MFLESSQFAEIVVCFTDATKSILIIASLNNENQAQYPKILHFSFVRRLFVILYQFLENE